MTNGKEKRNLPLCTREKDCSEAIRSDDDGGEAAPNRLIHFESKWRQNFTHCCAVHSSAVPMSTQKNEFSLQITKILNESNSFIVTIDYFFSRKYSNCQILIAPIESCALLQPVKNANKNKNQQNLKRIRNWQYKKEKMAFWKRRADKTQMQMQRGLFSVLW